MDFTVAAASSTRKTLSVSFSAADVDAAIDSAVAERRKTLALPGFRKGKVPAGLIEKRFGDDILPTATQEAIDKALATALKQENLQPLSAIDLGNPDGLFKRGAAYVCTLSFDVLPEIAFPPYTDLPVEEPKVTLEEKEVDEVLNHLRDDVVDLKPLAIARLPQDGDLADISYAGFDENHTPIKGVEGKFNVVLGKGQTLPDFEKLVKETLPGTEKEGPVAFPADYNHPELAGKTITMQVKVNTLQERKELPLDDEFAKKVGSETMDQLREHIREHVLNNKKQNVRAASMRKLLDGLMAQVSVDLPAGLVETRMRRVSAEYFANMQKQGQAIDEKAVKAFEAANREDVEKSLRPQVFLMALARKEGLTVSNEEVEMQIYSMATRAGQDYRRMSEAYRRGGLTNDMYDRLLADKGMEFIYSRAKRTEVGAPAEAPKTDANA